MGNLTDFFGSVFGLGYIGTKLIKEEIEHIERVSDKELMLAFTQKYTDLELEQRIEQEMSDPDKYRALWERIEDYRQNHTRESVWFPVELYDPITSSQDRRPAQWKYIDPFGWDDIGNRRLQIVGKDGIAQCEHKRNRTTMLEWLMFTYEKVPEHKCRVGTGALYKQEAVKYIRKNRKKYGI